MLPQLSSLVIDAKKELLREKVISVTRIMGVVTVPAAFFFLFFGTFIAESIFTGIDLQSARYVGQVLSAFSLAAIPLSLNLIGIRVLNAFENTQLQALSNAIINAVAVLLSLVAYELLPPERVVVGLAGAFTLSYWVGFVVTDLLLSRFIGSTLLIRTIPFYVKLTLLASVSVLLVYFTTIFLSINGNFITLVIVLLATSLIYLLLARVFQVREVGEMMKSILRR
jgi:putative peptidoglycan lipid II flippase